MKVILVLKAIAFSVPILFSSLLASWNLWFILGFVVMSLFNYIWWHGGYVGSKYDTDFDFLEHYHWAILLSIISIFIDCFSSPLSSFVYGVSMILWGDECFYQDHPFAVGSLHEKMSDRVGSILSITWAFSVLLKLHFLGFI